MKLHKFFDRFRIYDLVIIAIFAAIGCAVKPVVGPIVHLISGPLMIPGGALSGGLYMLWVILGYGIVKKPGTATLIGLVQALLVLFTGIIGSHGIMSFFTYITPGLAVDVFLLLTGHRICCCACTVLSCMIANLAGTACVNLVFFQAPGMYLVLILSIAALSGAVGGVIAWKLLKIMLRYHMISDSHVRSEDAAQRRRKNVGVAILCAALVVVAGATAWYHVSTSDFDTSGCTLTVSMDGEEQAVLQYSAICDMDSITLPASLQSASSEDESGDYTGVPLSQLLNDVNPDILETCDRLIFTAGDGYSSAVEASEVLEQDNVILCYAKDGEFLTPFEDGGTGPMRILIAKDTFGNRCLKNVVKIECQSSK